MGKSKIVFIDLRKAFLKLLIAIMIIILIFTYKWWTEVYLIEFTAPDWASSYKVSNHDFTKEFSHLIKEAKTSPITESVDHKFTMKLTSRRSTQTYSFDNNLTIYDKKQKLSLKPSPPLKAMLQHTLKVLKNKSPYGDITQWDTANKLIPINEKVKIRDLETGKCFTVVRKSGYSLARVKPVNNTDKATIKEIFGGKWSWKRRAVIVYLKETRAAACFVGMPQDEDQLFSLYFYSGRTNKSNNLSNKITIFKAAGKIKDMFYDTTAEESVLGALTAIDQGDTTTLNYLLTHPIEKGKLKSSGLVGLTLQNLYKKDDKHFKVLVSVNFIKGPFNHWRSINLVLKYNKKHRYYQLDPGFLGPLLKR